MGESTYKLSIMNLRLSVRFNHVIFPLSMMDFARNLSEKGFQLKTELPRPDTKSLGRLTYNGPLAARDQSVVDVNSERQFVGVMESDPESLMATFTEVSDLLKDHERNGGPLNVWFYELQCRMEYHNVESKMKRKKEKECLSIEQVMGFPVVRRGIRLSSDLKVDSPNYFDCAIEPIIGKEDHSYDCIMLLRNQDLGIISSFLANINERAGVIIKHCLE